MELIADIFLIAGALGAGFYCVILSRRLNRFTDLENGVGGAVAVLSKQVEEMTTALEAARRATQDTENSLGAVTGRAEGVAQKLELLVASLHDLPLDEVERKEAMEELITMFHSQRPHYDKAAE